MPPEPTQYLNVDLEIGSNHPVDALCRELTLELFELFRGRLDEDHLERAHYETRACDPTPSDAIRGLVEVLDGISPAARRCWRAADKRDFNIGVQAGFQRNCFELAIDPAVVRDVTRLGGRIVLTVYSPAAAPRLAARPAKAKRRPRSRTPATAKRRNTK